MSAAVALALKTPVVPIAVRAAEAGDRGLILDSWLKSFRESAWVRALNVQAEEVKARYFTPHEVLVRAILPRARTLVATPRDDPKIILGWICAEARCVHFVYVKRDFRRMGIARALFDALSPAPLEYSHRSDACLEIPAIEKLRYNPYWLTRGTAP